jgi:hypothetical protein
VPGLLKEVETAGFKDCQYVCDSTPGCLGYDFYSEASRAQVKSTCRVFSSKECTFRRHAFMVAHHGSLVPCEGPTATPTASLTPPPTVTPRPTEGAELCGLQLGYKCVDDNDTHPAPTIRETTELACFTWCQENGNLGACCQFNVHNRKCRYWSDLSLRPQVDDAMNKNKMAFTIGCVSPPNVS